jgi:WD40 repeat protein
VLEIYLFINFQLRIKVFRGHLDAVRSCKYIDNDSKIMSASDDKTIKMWVKILSWEEQNLTALKSNSNTVWFNFQTHIYIYIYKRLKC